MSYEHYNPCYMFARKHVEKDNMPKALDVIANPSFVFGIYDPEELKYLMDEIRDEFKMEFVVKCMKNHRDPASHYFEGLLREATTMGIYWHFISELTKTINEKGIENLEISDYELDLPESFLSHARYAYDEVLNYWMGNFKDPYY